MKRATRCAIAAAFGLVVQGAFAQPAPTTRAPPSNPVTSPTTTGSATTDTAPEAQLAVNGPAVAVTRAIAGAEISPGGPKPSATQSSGKVTPHASPYPGTPVQGFFQREGVQSVYYYVEYNPRDCTQVDSGEWTVTGPDNSNVTLGNVTLGTHTGPLTSGACGDKPFTFAEIRYERTAKTNQTKGIDPNGPVDFFGGRWRTKDGLFDLSFAFSINVEAVRPVGETVEFKGFFRHASIGYYGLWVSKLTPPAKYSDFDFKGDTVKESHFVRENTCQARAPFALGDPSAAGGAPIGEPAKWKVGQYVLYPRDQIFDAPTNYYGYDAVGWDTQAIQGYRCAGVTEPPCGTRVRQTMHHHAQSDNEDFFVAYDEHELGETISGSVVPEPNPAKTSTGIISSTKASTQFWPGATTNLLTVPFIGQRAKLRPDLLPRCASK